MSEKVFKNDWKIPVKSPFSKKIKIKKFFQKRFFDTNGVFKPFMWIFYICKNQKTECIDFCTKKVFEKC